MHIKRHTTNKKYERQKYILVTAWEKSYFKQEQQQQNQLQLCSASHDYFILYEWTCEKIGGRVILANTYNYASPKHIW